MKSEHTTWRKDFAEWETKTVRYFSIPFTWQVPAVLERIKTRSFIPKRVVVGGPGAYLLEKEFKGIAEVRREAPRGVRPLLLFNKDATFTTRGCTNRCRFCAVPRIEGEFKEIRNFRPAPIICDNNLLAASRKHIHRVIDSCKGFDSVDFNQGLEARLFTKDIGTKLTEIKCLLRFAFDNVRYEKHIVKAIEIAKAVGFKRRGDIRVYVLFGYKDTLEETIYRCELLIKLNVLPFPMRYQPLNAKKKNIYKPSQWDERYLSPISRYYSSTFSRWEGITLDEWIEKHGSQKQRGTGDKVGRLV